jgi:pyruvate formate lyase activating enzyme
LRFVDHYSRPLADGRILCEVCPRICNIGPGERGHCFVRCNVDGRMALASEALGSDFRIEAIEAAPLYHFLPGSAALAFGAADRNLVGSYREVHDFAGDRAAGARAKGGTPETIARAAAALGCASVVFADNDPTVYFEHAIDIAEACREQGIKTVATTAGYISPGPRAELFRVIDAANVDLKAFSESFYYRRAGAHLDAVLETLKFIRHETDVWLEITTLLIAGENDSEREIDALTGWIAEELGDETPLHFTVSHHSPTLSRAHAQAKANGLRHVYADEGEGNATVCAGCAAPLIVREGNRLIRYTLDAEGACRDCGRMLAGHFAATRGGFDGVGTSVDIDAYA